MVGPDDEVVRSDSVSGPPADPPLPQDVEPAPTAASSDDGPGDGTAVKAPPDADQTPPDVEPTEVTAPLTGSTDANADAATMVHEEPPPPSPPPPAAPSKPVSWWIPVSIAVVVLVVYAVVFGVLLNRTGGDVAVTVVTTTAASSSTTAAAAEPASTTVAPSTTRITSTTTATTTTTTTTLPPIPATGEAVAIGDLGLGASQLGPLQFGDATDDAAGILATTFGQPDTYFSVGEEFGLCPTERGRAILWGPLTAIFRDENATEVLVGYSVDNVAPGQGAHPASQLRTLSGIALGDTVDDIESAYSRVTYQPVDGEDAFLVLSNADGRTLVWGLLSDDDPAEVLSISSPRPCDGGPFSTS